MKIALIQCPVFGTYDPPVGLAQLSSCLKRDGHDVSVFDLNIEFYLKRTENYKYTWAWEQCVFWSKEDTVDKFFKDNRKLIDKYIKKIMAQKSRLVCFSVTNSSIISSLKIADLLKKKNKAIVTVFGGQLFYERSWIEDVLKHPCSDIVVFGEGEITICEIADTVGKRKKVYSCLGTAVKDRKKIIVNKPRPYIKNLDSLPFLDFSQLPFSNYDDPNHLPFMASRGCIFRCAFCSSREFWKGYRSMSGKRIFDEIRYHHINSDKKIRHVDFLDLLINGNMRSLIEFADLLIQAKFILNWSANAIIRPEMTPEVMRKLKESRCIHLIYGIESGSERVLSLMRKNYKIKDADMVLKATHDAGIMTTANFMFGFPGETEENFEETLDFIGRNSKSLDRVYPSRTFCALEQNSYLLNSYKEFGIKPGFSSHLYWESLDGVNTYPVRQQRCERFSKIAERLGIEVGCGVQSSLELDHWLNLAEYYEVKKDIKNATESYLNYFELDPKNEFVKKKIMEYFTLIDKERMHLEVGLSLIERLNDVMKNIDVLTASRAEEEKIKIKRPQSVVYLTSARKQNIAVNDREVEEGKVALYSFPKSVFVQVAGPCNSNCVFCSNDKSYKLFNLDEFRKRFEDKLSLALLNAETIALTGSGEFLLLPDAGRIIDYFDKNFPHVDKMFSTNGSSLVPWVAEKIVNSPSRYTIHVSLHASNAALHKKLTQTDNFCKILGQVNNILKLRNAVKKQSPKVNLVFVATTLNIHDLPGFVRLAYQLKADKVICYYNHIYKSSQEELSCFFEQELTVNFHTRFLSSLFNKSLN